MWRPSDITAPLKPKWVSNCIKPLLRVLMLLFMFCMHIFLFAQVFEARIYLPANMCSKRFKPEMKACRYSHRPCFSEQGCLPTLVFTCLIYIFKAGFNGKRRVGRIHFEHFAYACLIPRGFLCGDDGQREATGWGGALRVDGKRDGWGSEGEPG